MLSLFNFFLSTWRILKLNLQYFIYISSLKPGSHMPPTYLIPLRHGWTFIAESYSFQGIYRQLACEVELTQASRRLSAIKMLYWTSSVGATYPSKTIWSVCSSRMVKNCASSVCNLRQFEYIGDLSQMCRGPTDRGTLSVPTTSVPTSRYKELLLYSHVQCVKT